ncbi:MAG TPA: hypothetical protein PLI09_09565 [Candidatus Hydrogenedentes bacterium]|nr:hypothetical protein [Candidatus Hydrogenedentota bacterium]
MSRIVRLAGGIHLTIFAAILLGGFGGGPLLFYSLAKTLPGANETLLRISTLGSGAVKCSPNGAIGPEPILHQYPRNTVICLNPVPAPGWTFLRWDGDLSCTENPLSLRIRRPTQITALFIRSGQPQ